ncbi:DNA mismatch repair protein PMS2 [Capronia epimyces CBS 606.96]|uniref:DNA mismatch repair protein PMS1 n=1 Tax=Capronia epimyces CBS 606.96 TaxID=1182542 RepID=W9YII3_9EURO|nr:DNA mismatch repair protein PMS2 [Capronia epimyces CBS 606.96]EXJ89066.1 DNA mismatch repair protein PMS2 [Capronia epimyces CBS 606.96]
MATIKAIEAKSVHQIQSGQVIVDLCSVAKELIENSLDAGATSVEVRFRNNGLDAIEVQDNGSGISPANYDSIALKHYTSKLSSYEDLSNLQTFGFRGEALSSLCALSKFSVTTAQAEEAPKGKRLEFDVSGKLKSATLVACQKGTTATVEAIFESLPVRRKELAKNIKREYGKVLALLQAYACVCVNVKFTVKNTMPKGKSVTVFSTKANATTRENIANVYGAKTLAALVPLDLELEFRPTLTQLVHKDKTQSRIHVKGHISKPVFGEGRQTPDRQMFFVNGRPCGLPQIAKAINEVYKAFNVSQSPFIFADLQMDTNAYDVNVSPDKRTILLHDSAALIENLKVALNEMFDKHDQTVPQSQLQTPKLPAFQRLSFQRQASSASPDTDSQETTSPGQPKQQAESQGTEEVDSTGEDNPGMLFREHFKNFTSTRDEAQMDEKQQANALAREGKRAEELARSLNVQAQKVAQLDEYDDVHTLASLKDGDKEVMDGGSQYYSDNPHARDDDGKMDEQQTWEDERNSHSEIASESPEIPSTMPSIAKEEPGAVPNAFDRMRPKRIPAELATVQIGDKTITTILGTQFPRAHTTREQTAGKQRADAVGKRLTQDSPVTYFSQKLRKFGAEAADVSDEEEVAGHSKASNSAQSDSGASEELGSEESEDSQHSGEDGESDDEPPDKADIPGDESDTDYIDEAEKKKAEEARVAELIRAAEEKSAIPSKDSLKRATKALTAGQTKDSTTNLLATVQFSTASVARQMRALLEQVQADLNTQEATADSDHAILQDPETRLSLTVSKEDFAEMAIVGQFNLGFILAVRPAKPRILADRKERSGRDELFIIDQHASDEKYNFERLQAETVVGNQRLVRPAILDLTAVEEEIVLENKEGLEKNGFVVEMDMSGESMVGQRCRLVSLPLSKEVVFNTQDLEELIHLLAEAPGLGSGSGNEAGVGVPRPAKVRKMFAMRACRSSIMIGKTLSKKQMEKVVSHMGTIDKPWNCPHGRPTMRHLCSLNALESWHEGDEETGEDHVGLGEALHRYVAGGEKL